MPEPSAAADWLPLVFLGVMGLAILIYVVLDGYDLGVGILLGLAGDDDRDIMIAAIGPFWDANETWLVLGIGVLLTAFPLAQGMIMGALYLPVAAMLAGLILRGAAFDFRVKARDRHKPWWNRAFCAGSLLAAISQGYMLGLLVVGFERTPVHVLFALGIALGLVAGYCLLGAGWLLIKTEGSLQRRALRWARAALGLTAFGVAAVSVATPLLSREIFEKWFSLPNFFLLAPVPLATIALVGLIAVLLGRLPARLDKGVQKWAWLPFGASVGVFVLAFHGLAYSFYPWIVPQRMDVWQAAAAPASLTFILIGVAVVLPLIIVYTVFVYWVFRGKASRLDYG